MRIEFTVCDRQGPCRDLAVTAPAGSALRDIDAALADVLGCERPVELWIGARRVARTALLGGPGLRTGAAVTVGRPGAHDSSAAAVLCLHVVGGPDAGRVVALPRGMLTIGRAADCGLVLTDPDVSRRHACLTVTAGGVTVRDLESSNGSRIDGVPVDEDGSALSPGDVLRLGDSFLSIGCLDEPRAAARSTPTGAVLINRPPRPSTPVGPGEIEFPTRRERRPAQRVQWIGALLPALAGIGLAWSLHSPQFLVFALLSPVIVLGTSLGDRLHWRGSRRREAGSWRRREASAHAQSTAALAHETVLRRRAHPDPTLVHHLAAAPAVRLWERRPGDPDALSVRLGLAELSSAVRARHGATALPAGRLRDVPAGIDLRQGPLGIAAPGGIGLGIMRWLVCQVAVLHSPVDVEFALLLSLDSDATWAWARWLPHLKRPAASTPEQQLALLAELSALVEQRRAGQRNQAAWTGKWLVLIIDRATDVTELPGLAALLAIGPTVGVTAICVNVHRRALPTACVASAVATGETGSHVALSHAGSVEPLIAVADRVTVQWAESVARALAPLEDSGGGVDNALPRQCRLLELLGIEHLDVTALRGRWARHDGRLGTMLGMGVDGVVRVDLVRDGPHALVGGTTGAGKSELLQSLVAGLAANYPPDAVTFLLIDYKGGAAFADCARLPHTVGLVTDLDTQLTERALRSLQCELGRRETAFAKVGAVDLTGYRAVAPPGDDLARLVLVVDEFAALAQELPDFVSGLISIAQRGRSLGVHLVLATQRPGGVVSPEIRANATLRIALRMSDPTESCDVIGTDRAALFGRDSPGRAIVRTGTTLTDLQTARVGGPAHDRSAEEISVTPLGPWRTPPDSDTVDAGTGTDLRLLVDALRAAAAAQAAMNPPRRAWLPPLPAQLSTAALPRTTAATSITIGLVDLPDRQQQLPLQLDLAAGGSVLFTGAARSGRTTALLTIALVAAQQLDCAELAIYAVDCAGGGMAAVADLPQCGTAVGRENFELVEALLRRLEAAVHERQAALAQFGASSVRDARAAAHPLPLILCLLDGWDAFVALAEEYDGGRSADILGRVLRAAASVGMTVVLAGDRATLSARMSGAVADKFVLRLTERADYGLAGVPAQAVPRDIPPGRAIRAEDAAEVQIAFAGSAPSRTEQHRKASAIRAHTGERVADGVRFPPIRLRPLPTHVGLAQLPAISGQFTIGVAGDAAEPLTVDLFAGVARLLVVGPPRSGRSTALCSLLVQAVRDDVAVVLAARHRTLLARSAEANGIDVLRPDTPAAGASVPDRPHVLLLVDDSETFLDTPVGDALTGLVRSAPLGLSAVVAANSEDLPLTYRGVAAEVRRSRCALVLQPGPGDGDLVGQRLIRRRGLKVPGRGLLVADPAWGDRFALEPVAVQVAQT